MTSVGGPTEGPAFRAVPMQPDEAKKVDDAAKPQPVEETELEFQAQKGPVSTDESAQKAAEIAQQAIRRGWLRV